MAKTIPLSVPEDLLIEVKETARLTHLSVQDVFRQSVKIAKPVLRQSARTEKPSVFLCGMRWLPAPVLNCVCRRLAGAVKKVSL